MSYRGFDLQYDSPYDLGRGYILVGCPTPMETSSSTRHGAGALCPPGVLGVFSQRCLAPTPSDIHFPDYGYFLIAVSNVWNVRDLGETVLIAAVWGTSGSPVAGLAETTGRNVWSNPAPFQTFL